MPSPSSPSPSSSPSKSADASLQRKDEESTGKDAMGEGRQQLSKPNKSRSQQQQQHPNGSEKQSLQKYARGPKAPIHTAKDKKLRANLKKLESKYKEAATKARDAEILLPESRGYLEAEDMERTYKFTQKAIVKEVDVGTAQKVGLKRSLDW